ncbi:carbohydrate-binding module family 13 protein [Rhizophagus irregularis DAOM 181602=DAOM 197198]|nr:carbohydrate-binding module family 13 protein [Rhizophagus irregularis DAOM 181602=DAOM 197198]
MADDKFLPKLSQNLLEILDDEEYYDITIEVAHIKLPNILPEIFQIILRYFYGGRISLAEYDILDIIKILLAANELSIQELIPHLQSFLIKNKANWMEQNFNLIYQTSFENNSFLDLQKFCTELISNQPEKIFNSSDFTSIPEKALISLIQHDKVKMSEVQIWEHVLEWGIAKNTGFSSDPSSYSNDDFNALKNTLQQFIPLIKFTEFTSREFLNKVYPYKKVIPEDLQDNLFKYFLDHDYVPRKKSESQITKLLNTKGIDSNIITIQHAELISKWIDKLEITDELKNSYKFKLILRGSRDGFTAQKFHEICDNKSCTVAIIKVKESNEILGGYNPIEWKNNTSLLYNYGTTKDSFIFSFANKDNIENCLISRVKDEKHAVVYWQYHGPTFGGRDLTICGGFDSGAYFNKNTNSFCQKKSYEKQIRVTSDKFSIEEYEVFQIHNE